MDKTNNTIYKTVVLLAGLFMLGSITSPVYAASFACTPASQSATVGRSVSFSALNGNDHGYHWSAPGGSPSSADGASASFSTQYSSPGNYVVTVSEDNHSATCNVTVSSDGGGGTTNPPTVDLKANGSDGSTTIDSGTAATLSWSSTNATSCSASGDWSGSKPPNNSESTGNLTSTRFYSITCSNSAGSANDSVVVNVRTQVADPTVTLIANPSSVLSGNQSILIWASNNATSCFTSGGPWVTTGTKNISGSEATTVLTQNTTFSITCQNSVGRMATANATVTVTGSTQLPTVDLIATPSSVLSGNRSTLSWTSTNADSCFASGGPWSGNNKSTNSSEQTGVLTQSATFSITCVNNSNGLSATDSATVTVTQDNTIAVTLIANPNVVNQGGSSILSWTSTNAAYCYGDNSNWFGNKSVPTGSEPVTNLQSTRTYRITCANSQGNTASADATVTVNQTQLTPTVTITASPNPVNSGNQSQLTWYSTNATTCNASGGPWNGPKNLSSNEFTQGLSVATTFSITCQSSSGQTASANVTVNVINQTQVPTVTLFANPNLINQGGASTLSWTSQNATSCYADGGVWYGSKILSGSESVTNINSNQTFAITCQNNAGQSARATAIVNVMQNNTPPTVSIYASPNPVLSGTQSNLFWNSSNATSCYASGGPWTGTKIISGQEATAVLTSATNFAITCQNSSGQTASANVTVNVQNNPNNPTNNPPTLNLYANPSVVSTGSNSTLYWNTTNADSCYASDGWSGSKVVNSSQSVGPINTVQNYILTCTGPGGSVTRNTTVSPQGQVLGSVPPTLTIYAIPTPVQYGNSSTVYWNAQNVDSCYASNSWFGNKNINGQYATGPLFADSTYTLTCYGTGGSITRSAVVPVIRQTYVPPTYIPPTYVPPTCPIGGCVQGITGTYSASIEKTIENLSIPGAIGSTVSARPGNELRYTITVRNTGTLTLTNLVVRDPLTDKVEVKTISDNGTYDYTNRTVTWKIARLTPGESKTLTLTVRVVMCDSDVVIENRAYVDNSQISEISSNSTVAGVTTGQVTVTIENSQNIVRQGDKVTYTIRYRNDGSTTVRDAKLAVHIPSGMIIEGYTQTCTISGNTVSLNIGDINPGQNGQVVVNAKIDDGVLDGEVLITRAMISYRDASGVTRESTGTTISTVDRDGNGDKDSEFAATTSEGTGRGLRFLPDTFFGWLLLLLLIIVLAIFIKRLLSKDEDTENKDKK